MLRARTLRGGEITLGVTLSKRGTHRRRRRRAPLFDVLVVLTGLATAILLAAPAAVWHHKTSGSVYSGFDPNLLSLNADGFGTDNPGLIQASSTALRITTISSSGPSVHLLTTSPQ